MNSPSLTASCHCKDVSIEVNGLPATLTSCNCSICHRLGALWAYYQPEQVKIRCKPGATIAYRWGDECIDFHHCARCGTATHWLSTGKCSEPKMTVNARLFAPDLIEGATIRRFDGADSWQYLD
jgi:hypothetical protein